MSKPTKELRAMAQRLYPDSRVLQAKWLRAVRVVRGTSRGWLMDQPVPRGSNAQQPH